nr:5-hydroxytryptamine receptor 3A-like [Solea senegalensis]
MLPVVFLVLLFLTDGVSPKKVCSYQDVLDYLNLTFDNSMLQLTRPVVDHTHPTVVELDLILYAILAVIEKTQTFIPFLWATVMWNNEHISWDPAQFCGITHISIPKNLLWRPDLFIYEMTRKDESPQNPHMYLSYDGKITSEEDMNVVSTCKLDVHKFPFDTQRCNISIGSAIHSADEIRILPFSNSSRATQFSRELMKSQGEWEFLQLSITSYNFSYHNRNWEQLIYTFTIKRRPFLHVINFLLPILFFLCLDLASFFISDCRGEKLGFKVTVLLAISVLLLILNDILPCMSNKTPLIATYCIVIFGLMLLSLLETILVTYLMEFDSASLEKRRLKDDCRDKEDKEEKDNTDDSYAAEKRWTRCSCICNVSEGEKEHEVLPLAPEANRSIQSREGHVLLLILKEMKVLQKTINLCLSSRDEGRRPGRWATRINRAFFIFYLTTVSLFLSLIFYEWNS